MKASGPWAVDTKVSGAAPGRHGNLMCRIPHDFQQVPAWHSYMASPSKPHACAASALRDILSRLPSSLDGLGCSTSCLILSQIIIDVS
jgi:hypothetical protein